MSIAPAKKDTWFSNLEPGTRLKLVVGGALALLVIVVYFSVGDGMPIQQKKTDEEKSLANLLGNNTDGSELGIKRLSKDQTSTQQEIEDLREELRQLREGNTPGANSLPGTPEQSTESLLALQNDLSRQTYQTPGVGNGSNAAPVPIVAPTLHTIEPEATASDTSDGDKEGASSDAKDPATVKNGKDGPSIYLPAGSLMTGVLITGLDAPTGRNASGQPVPVLVRIKHEAILPSRYRADVREAFVLAAGFGDMASERTYLRSERLSMVLSNGNVIDVAVEMSAVGSDGKAGLRSRLVSKQGKVMRNATLAAFGDSLAKALSQNNAVRQAADAGLDPSVVAQQAAFSGAGTGLQKISEHYLDIADQMYPVLETPAGREVTFLLLKGVTLPLVNNPESRR